MQLNKIGAALLAQLLLLTSSVAFCPTVKSEVLSGSAAINATPLRALTPKLDGRVVGPLQGHANYLDDGVGNTGKLTALHPRIARARTSRTRTLRTRVSRSHLSHITRHYGALLSLQSRKARTDDRVRRFGLKADKVATASSLNDPLRAELQSQFKALSGPFDLKAATKRCTCGGKGYLLGEQHKWSESAAYYQEHVGMKDENKVHNYNGLAWALAHTGAYDESISNATTAWSLDNHAYFVIGTRGYAYLRKGEFKNAIADLETAVQLNPTDGEDWYYLGLAYYRSGRLKDAAHALQTAGTLKFIDRSDDWQISAI